MAVLGHLLSSPGSSVGRYRRELQLQRCSLAFPVRLGTLHSAGEGCQALPSALLSRGHPSPSVFATQSGEKQLISCGEGCRPKGVLLVRTATLPVSSSPTPEHLEQLRFPGQMLLGGPSLLPGPDWAFAAVQW